MSGMGGCTCRAPQALRLAVQVRRWPQLPVHGHVRTPPHTHTHIFVSRIGASGSQRKRTLAHTHLPSLVVQYRQVAAALRHRWVALAVLPLAAVQLRLKGRWVVGHALRTASRRLRLLLLLLVVMLLPRPAGRVVAVLQVRRQRLRPARARAGGLAPSRARARLAAAAASRSAAPAARGLRLGGGGRRLGSGRRARLGRRRRRRPGGGRWCTCAVACVRRSARCSDFGVHAKFQYEPLPDGGPLHSPAADGP